MTRDEILIRIMSAKEFDPHKVEYYKEILKEYDLLHLEMKTKKLKQ